MSQAEKKRKRRKRKKWSLARSLNALGDVYSYYRQILRPLGILACIVVAGFLVYQWRTSGVEGRTQIEFANRTTSKWLELEREGKARNTEALWKDQRWMPLEQVLLLDWAAVPILFDALLDERTRALAESTLGRYPLTSGSPIHEDVLAGLRHEQGIIRLWSARLAAKLETGTEEVIPYLEAMTDDPDEETSAAASESLTKLRS